MGTITKHEEAWLPYLRRAKPGSCRTGSATLWQLTIPHSDPSTPRAFGNPDQDHGPEGFLVRLDDGRGVVVPADPYAWRTFPPLVAALGCRRRFNRESAPGLLRALEEATRD